MSSTETGPGIYDLNTPRGCMAAITDMRHSCRRLVGMLQPHWDEIGSISRQIRILRRRGDAMSKRRADVLQERVDGYQEAIRPYREQLVDLGGRLFWCAEYIDRALPQEVVLDLLNVNLVDRSQVKPDDGIAMIVFGHGLENSVEGRGKDFLDTPLFKACHSRFARELASNRKLEAATNEMMFGAGGIFEFLPTYNQQPDGSMKRNPPRLRVADPALDAAERWRDE